MTPRGATHEPNDPLIESCLEEVLGGHAPPDFKEQILIRHAERKRRVIPPPTPAVPPAPPVQVATGSVTLGRRSEFAGSRSRNWSRKFVAMLMTTIAIGLVAWLGLRYLPQQQPDAAGGAATAASSEPVKVQRSTAVASDKAIPRQLVNVPDSTTQPLEPPVAKAPIESEPPPIARGPEAPMRLANGEIVGLINEQIRHNLEIANVEPAAMISDETWCRRVYQRLLGRTASNDEMRQFTRAEGDRRQALLDQLFHDERYQKEYASYWSAMWTNRLLNHALDTKHASSLRAGLSRYLQSAFQENLPHDEWAAELVAAEGSNSLQAADYNGASNYLLALRDNQHQEDSVLVASEVCRVLLGQRVQCAQCHDDRRDKRTQQSFWELTAFFRQLDAETIRPGKFRLVDRSFAGDPGAADGAVRFQRHKDGSWQHALPRFLDGTEINSNGNIAVSNRRQEFAQLMTESAMFSEAAVNRIWAHFLSFGFTSPVDDMGRHNPAAHPELLASLAQQFALHDFDTQQLIRWIVMSKPFNRSDVITAANGNDAPLLGSMAYFSRFYHRPILFSGPMESLAALTNGEAKTVMLQVPGIDLMLNAQIQQLLNDEKSATRKRDKANVVAFGDQISSGQKRLAVNLAKSSMSSEQKTKHVFLAILGRQPTLSELKRSLAIYEAAKRRNKSLAIEKLIWALTRTSEFVNLH